MGKIRKLLLYVCIMILLLVPNISVNAAQKQVDYEKSDDIIVVLDVSGSMAATDEERLSFETIELLMKLSDSVDHIGVVAFNEAIVYQSELTQIQDRKAIEGILEELNQIKYQGDTDNGLGLRAGLELLEETGQEERNQAIIFISDGKIDLPDPVNGRTIEDSERDMEMGIEEAKEKGIPIYTFCFASSEPEIVDELTAVATATQGSSHICKGPLQMMNDVLGIAMNYKDEYSREQITVKPDEKLQKYELELNEQTESYIIFQASAQMEDFEVVAPGMKYEITGTKHCKVISFEKKQSGKVTLCYRTGEECNAIISDIRFNIEEEIEPISGKVPIAILKPEETEEEIQTQVEQKEETDKGLWVSIVILAIVTGGACTGIIYAFFHKNRKKVSKQQPVLEGYLQANFIDLKSKNDIPEMLWNLKDYPAEGVTLKELFVGKDIHEDLPQLEQIYLYPNEDGPGLTLVHCTTGGIFIDDKTVSQNVPAHVRFGETIYVAFPENASEISLKYYEKKEEIERCM